MEKNQQARSSDENRGKKEKKKRQITDILGKLSYKRKTRRDKSSTRTNLRYQISHIQCHQTTFVQLPHLFYFVMA